MNAHKKIRELMSSESKKITDEMFFISKELKRHFEDVAAASCGRYGASVKIKVNLYKGKDEIACTDDRTIFLNVNSPFIAKGEGRKQKYRILTGVFAHELGHVLYTDFASEMSWDRYLQAGKWYPAKSEFPKKISEEILNSYSEDYIILRKVFHDISNILEDGYIENRILLEFPGTLGSGLKITRKIHYDSIPTVAELIKAEEESGGHIFMSILQNLLSYSKFGEIKYGGVSFSNERISVIFDLLSDIDDYIDCHDGKMRLFYLNKIIVFLWPYIKDYVDFIKKKAEESGKSEKSVSEEMSSSLEGTSTEGTGKSSSVVSGEPDHSSGSSASSALSKKREKTAKDKDASSKSKKGDKEEKPQKKRGRPKKSESSSDSESGSITSEKSEGKEDESSKETDGFEKKEDTAEESSAVSSDPEDSESETSGAESEDSGESSPPSSADEGELPHDDFDPDAFEGSELTEYDGEAETEYDDAYEAEENDRADAEIEKLLDEMAEKAAESRLENDRISELQDFSDRIDYGHIHDGLTKKIFRQKEIGDSVIEQYNSIAPPLIAISKRLQKSIQQQIKDARMGGRNYGLYMGKRIDRSALYRNDGRLFYKTNLPEDVPQLAVGLLLDESGSMHRSQRDVSARATGIVLYDFCRSLDIPICIYGHSTYDAKGKENVALYAYSEFDEIDKNDKYRLMDVHARHNNRDGAALRFVAERLMTRPEQEKILIIVSDGAPAAIGYYGDEPKGELQAIKKEYTRKGILFQAAAIGDDKQRISEIYGDSFLDITDLNQLPVLLTKVIKRHIRT